MSNFPSCLTSSRFVCKHSSYPRRVTRAYQPVRLQQQRWSGPKLPSIRLRSKANNALMIDTVLTSIEEVSHNQVLASSLLAGVLAQLLKPFSSLIGGRGFNWRLVVKSGGMPSSHSAGVVAAATAIGLERGLSDSVFGLSVVIACIVMYDAQGVRRAVGKQAEVINTLVLSYAPASRRAKVSVPKIPATVNDSEEHMEDVSNLQGPYARSSRFFRKAETLPSVKEGEVSLQEIGEEDGWRHIPLKESVGHTKLQVLAGAFLGIALTVAFHSKN